MSAANEDFIDFSENADRSPPDRIFAGQQTGQGRVPQLGQAHARSRIGSLPSGLPGEASADNGRRLPARHAPAGALEGRPE